VAHQCENAGMKEACESYNEKRRNNGGENQLSKASNVNTAIGGNHKQRKYCHQYLLA
jgi:hypothetical protein